MINVNEPLKNIENYLPPKLKMVDFQSWSIFFEHVYKVFTQDFITSKPNFRGIKIGFKRMPEYYNKSSTFWHIVSSGEVEAEREPCIERCERIVWPRPIIDHSEHDELKVWVEKQKGEDRVHILYEQEGYIVVLNKRKGYWLFWTAFYIEKAHQITKYNRRYNRNKHLEIII